MKPQKKRKPRQVDFLEQMRQRETRAVNKYQKMLERKLETVSFVDELRTLTRLLKKRPKGYIRDRKKWTEFQQAGRRAGFLRRKLAELGIAEKELAGLLRKRKTERDGFYSEVSGEVEKYAKQSPENATAVDGIRREVRTWNFVDAENSGDVDFHTLIEIRRMIHRTERLFR